MLKVVYRNKFRVRNLDNNEIVFLNVKADKTGTYRFAQGFNSYVEAKKHLDIFLQVQKGNFVIESYSDSNRQQIEVQDLETNELLAALKAYSGKGLKYNTFTPMSVENKYNPSKFYGREVYMYQSLERAKGKSVHKNKNKKLVHRKATVLPQFHNLTLETAVAQDIARHFKIKPTRKEVHDYLRDRRFTWKQTKKITGLVFNQYK